MTTNEVSIGGFYAATEKASRRWFFPVVGEITEMCEPWRRGKCLVFPTGTYNVLAIGWWTRDIQDDIALDFPDDWPEWMQSWDSEDTEPQPGWLKGAWLKDWEDVSEEEEEEPTGGVEGT